MSLEIQDTTCTNYRKSTLPKEGEIIEVAVGGSEPEKAKIHYCEDGDIVAISVNNPELNIIFFKKAEIDNLPD